MSTGESEEYEAMEAKKAGFPVGENELYQPPEQLRDQDQESDWTWYVGHHP